MKEDTAERETEALGLFEQTFGIERQERTAANYEVGLEEGCARREDPEKMTTIPSRTRGEFEPFKGRVKSLDGYL